MTDIKSSERTYKNRMISLDVLRGFDMFWIVGGSALAASLAKNYDAEWLNNLAIQFKHVKWEGFHFFDLIFPLFMFISGAVIPFSLLSKLEKGLTEKQLILKTSRRVILLIFLGIIYNGTLRDGFSEARYVSVLGQIGVAYFFTVLIVLFSGSTGKKLLWLIIIITGVAFLQLFVPVPGIGADVLTPEGCINGYIDRMILPGRLVYGAEGYLSTGQGIYDALGILSTLSSVGVTLMGYFAGTILKSEKPKELHKVLQLSVTGAGLVILSLLLNPVYPVIKNCWTSTFSLLTGGISFILVALFFLIIDVWKWKKWSLFFRVIGMNSLFIYLFCRLVNVEYTSKWLFGWVTVSMDDKATRLILSVGNILLIWLLLYYMYRKRIFIKI